MTEVLTAHERMGLLKDIDAALLELATLSMRMHDAVQRLADDEHARCGGSELYLIGLFKICKVYGRAHSPYALFMLSEDSGKETHVADFDDLEVAKRVAHGLHGSEPTDG